MNQKGRGLELQNHQSKGCSESLMWWNCVFMRMTGRNKKKKKLKNKVLTPGLRIDSFTVNMREKAVKNLKENLRSTFTEPEEKPDLRCFWRLQESLAFLEEEHHKIRADSKPLYNTVNAKSHLPLMMDLFHSPPVALPSHNLMKSCYESL